MARKNKKVCGTENMGISAQHHKSIISQIFALVKQKMSKPHNFYEINKNYLWSFYKLPYCKMQKDVVYYRWRKEGTSPWKTDLQTKG